MRTLDLVLVLALATTAAAVVTIDMVQLNGGNAIYTPQCALDFSGSVVTTDPAFADGDSLFWAATSSCTPAQKLGLPAFHVDCSELELTVSSAACCNDADACHLPLSIPAAGAPWRRRRSRVLTPFAISTEPTPRSSPT